MPNPQLITEEPSLVSVELAQFIKYQTLANLRQDKNVDKLTASIEELVKVAAKSEAAQHQILTTEHRLDGHDEDIKKLYKEATINTVSSKDIKHLKYILITAFVSAFAAGIWTMAFGVPPAPDAALTKIVELLEQTRK